MEFNFSIEENMGEYEKALDKCIYLHYHISGYNNYIKWLIIKEKTMDNNLDLYKYSKMMSEKLNMISLLFLALLRHFLISY
ncbi:MAG: hypothetical protein WBJ13_03155 [Sedimentibacter sp.]